MERSWAVLITALGILAVTIGAGLFLARPRNDRGWVKVPRDVYAYDQLPGEEVSIGGFLEVNDRIILAIPVDGEATLITEEEVDGIAAEGLTSSYDFRRTAWTHRICSETIDITPSYEANGSRCYVILSSGTEAWKSGDLLNEFAGKEVEMIGKWDHYTDEKHTEVSVIQFQPKLIREAPQG